MAKFMLAGPEGSDVRVGRHYHKGFIYQDGDVIEDDRDLVALFENKFVRVADETPVTPGRLKAPPDAVAADAKPRELQGEHRPNAT
jgi:hypothetical protein